MSWLSVIVKLIGWFIRGVRFVLRVFARGRVFVALRWVTTFGGIIVVVVEEDRTFIEVVFGGRNVVRTGGGDCTTVITIVTFVSVVCVRSGVPGDDGSLDLEISLSKSSSSRDNYY